MSGEDAELVCREVDRRESERWVFKSQSDQRR